MANTSSSKAKATSMADLMANYKTSFQTFRKGDLVKGIITKLNKNEILVDVKAKTQAVVLEKDKNMLHSLLETLKVGDEVEVSVLNPESDAGNPVVSLRRFLSNAAWEVVEKAQKDEKQIEVKVTDLTKGGLVVAVDNGLTGFLPNSHMAGEKLAVGKKVKVRAIEVNRADNKIIFSQKSSISTQDFDDAVKQFKKDETVNVTVMNIVPFGVFVNVVVPGKKNKSGEELTLDGLIHISEVSWDKVTDLSALYTTGQTVETKIIGFDKNTRRVDLSVKQLSKDPFEKLVENYPLDKKITAVIIKIDDNGAYLALDGLATDVEQSIEGLIRKDKIPPTVNYEKGQSVTVTVSEIDKRRRRIYFVPVLLDKPLMYR